MHWKKIRLVASVLLYVAIAEAQVVADSNLKDIRYSSSTRRPLRILFDYYHHSRPETKVGNYMVTGSWVAGAGRYAWNDFVHSNTFDPVFTALGDEHQITIGGKPLTKQNLAQYDAVLIINPDNPKVVPGVPMISDQEIDNLKEFVKNGGSLMIMINAATPDRANEDFESVQLKKLVRVFGLDWNLDDTHYSDVVIGPQHPYFYDVPIFHYGAGCTIKVLPQAKKPEVLMEVASDAGYPDRHVRGRGIVMVREGKGKFILVGDVGSWTGNMARPWAENEKVLKQLFRYMKPDNNVRPAQFPAGEKLNYAVTISALQAVPVKNSISEIKREHFKLFSPRERTSMPYLEGTAEIELMSQSKNPNQSFNLIATIRNLKWFQQLVSDSAEKISFIVSRQGKVTNVEPKGQAASWISPDISSVIALLPTDGVSPGDRWENEEFLRIPILQATHAAPLRKINLEVTYVHDEIVNGRECRLLRSAREVWLNDLEVEIKDILPADVVNTPGGSSFQYFNRRGGKFLFKKEQWVDKLTGFVIKATTQSRILAWVQDLRKPVDASNADKDNNMIMSFAQNVSIEIK